jgi:hypothetical protein
MAGDLPRGEVLTLEKVWELSQAWYWDRLSPSFRGRSPAEASAVFAQVGLTSPFWQPFEASGGTDR